MMMIMFILMETAGEFILFRFTWVLNTICFVLIFPSPEYIFVSPSIVYFT